MIHLFENAARLPLGKLAPKPSNRTLSFKRYASMPALGTPPPFLNWSAWVNVWPMMLNDRIGDCTYAAIGHIIQCMTAVANAPAYIPPDSEILAGYIRTTGYEGAAYDPRTGANDNGCAMTDCLNDWTDHGIGGHKILGHVQINTHNTKNIQAGFDKVKWGLAIFGPLYIGLSLPVSAQSQLVWRVPDHGPHGSGAPGSWGGHAVPIVAYDKTHVTVVTWGSLQMMTWNFLYQYCDEAYAVVSEDWRKPDGFTPDGINFNLLYADMQLVAG